MRWLLLLPLAVSAAIAQPSGVADTLLVEVRSTAAGGEYGVRGSLRLGGPILHAGGTLVVRTAGPLRVLVTVSKALASGVPGTSGPSSALVMPPQTTGALHMRPPLDADAAAASTLHRVSVLVCTDATAATDAEPDPPCRVWEPARPASDLGGGPGFVLEITDEINAGGPGRDAPMREDPPVRPVIDR